MLSLAKECKQFPEQQRHRHSVSINKDLVPTLKKAQCYGCTVLDVANDKTQKYTIQVGIHFSPHGRRDDIVLPYPRYEIIFFPLEKTREKCSLVQINLRTYVNWFYRANVSNIHAKTNRTLHSLPLFSCTHSLYEYDVLQGLDFIAGNIFGEIMIVYFLACLDPSGTVVGNPGTGSIYQARTTVAESEGFTYMEASISLESILLWWKRSCRYNRIRHESTSSIQTTTYRSSEELLHIFIFSPNPCWFRYQWWDRLCRSGDRPEHVCTRQYQNQRTCNRTVGKNWLNLRNGKRIVLQGLLENTSNVYSDDNENGELEEEEQDNPITELEGGWIYLKGHGRPIFGIMGTTKDSKMHSQSFSWRFSVPSRQKKSTGKQWVLNENSMPAVELTSK